MHSNSTFAAPASGLTARSEQLGASRREWERTLERLGAAPYRAGQIMKWIYHRNVRDFEEMTDLRKELRTRLSSCFDARTPRFGHESLSEDGTRKWRFDLDRRNSVESVYIPDPPRGTLCVSSQVGCALNCSFCATARQGFNRNLSAAEIVGQLYAARSRLLDASPSTPPITNVVFMGMGEPLLNFENVVSALEIMQDDCAFGLARKRITVSTAGVVPGIRKLKQRCPVSLAVSLHAPDDELRDELVPLNRTWPIAALLEACREYVRALPRERVTFEYVLLDRTNDTPAHARNLLRCLQGIPAKVNLIPFNPFAGAGYRRSPPETIERFRNILLAGGLMTITRQTRGADIDAACGQLAGRVLPRSRRVRRLRTLDESALPTEGPAA